MYDVHERVSARCEDKHGRDCHALSACVVCGCPITRGGIEQYRRHRKANCALWRVLLHCDLWLQWLNSNNFIEDGHYQFFARGVATSAPTRAEREAEMKNAQDVKGVLPKIKNGFLFGEMASKGVEETLRAEQEAKALSMFQVDMMCGTAANEAIYLCSPGGISSLLSFCLLEDETQ